MGLGPWFRLRAENLGLPVGLGPWFRLRTENLGLPVGLGPCATSPWRTPQCVPSREGRSLSECAGDQVFSHPTSEATLFD